MVLQRALAIAGVEHFYFDISSVCFTKRLLSLTFLRRSFGNL